MVNEKNALSTPQENQLYSGDNYIPDEWEQCGEKPTRLYQLDFDNGQDEIASPKSNYFIDEDTYNSYLKRDENGNLVQDENGNNVFDVQRYCNDAQIAPFIEERYDEAENPILDENGNPVSEASYKNHISCYDVPHSDIEMWEGNANANDQYGTGGAKQYFVPDEDLQKLSKNDNFVSPTIPEEDRYVDPAQARNDINKGNDRNEQKRNEVERTPMKEEAEKADEISNGNTNNTSRDNPTMSEVAGENNLPETTPSVDNSLGKSNSVTQ